MGTTQIQFTDWLQAQLDKRGWDQATLARRTGLSRGAISHVMNSDRQAGVEFCIAVARGLGIAREEIFKARGWLADQPYPVVPEADPRLSGLAETVRQLPVEQRELILDAWEATLRAVGISYEPLG